MKTLRVLITLFACLVAYSGAKYLTAKAPLVVKATAGGFPTISMDYTTNLCPCLDGSDYILTSYDGGNTYVCGPVMGCGGDIYFDLENFGGNWQLTMTFIVNVAGTNKEENTSIQVNYNSTTGYGYTQWQGIGYSDLPCGDKGCQVWVVDVELLEIN